MAGRSLARLGGDYITYVQLLAQAPAGNLPAAQAVRGQLLALLEPVAKGGQTGAISSEEIEEARFALVIWADEVLLRREWSGRPEWQAQPLQMQLYGIARGGNEFFEHLARLGPEQNAAREIYLLALIFGFEGQYAGQQAERQALIQHQFQTLRARGGADEASSQKPLTPAAYQLEDVELPPVAGWGVLGWLFGMGVLLAGCYGVLWGALYLLGGEVSAVGGG